jgi:hypothetical protein
VKRAAGALRQLVGRVAGSIGLEGTFLVTGTVLLAVASTYLSPAGPWAVVGAVSLVLGLALAVPTRRAE